MNMETKTINRASYLERRCFDEEIIKCWRLKENTNQEFVKINYYDAGGKYLYYRKNFYGSKLDYKPKYKSPKSGQMPGEHSWLYGLWMLDQIGRLDTLLITEGEYNCISCWIMGHYALGVSGQTMHFRDYHLRDIPKNIKKIILLYDERKFAVERAKEIFEYFDYKIEVYIAEYGLGNNDNKLDANDYLVKGLMKEFGLVISSAEKYETPNSMSTGTLIKLDKQKENFTKIPKDDFVQMYCDEYAGEVTDAPRKYHEIIALGVIATIVNRNVYLEGGVNSLYPNLWIVIIGKSTIMRKTASLNLGSQFER